ncbi:MAG TPA: ABC transporter ATP-binding protein [Usitatibacter sp.]|nr:ABC transporter ATP-binding protein [Usitatibacter sp.]
MSAAETVLEVRSLTVDLPEGADRRHAVADVSFELHRNEILCLVGESGSGKSVTSRAIMGLLAHGVRASSGEILFRGEDLLRATPKRMRELRGSRISMIFQEPMTALNPLKRVGDQVDEVIAVHTGTPKAKRIERIVELFDAVQLPEPRRLLRSFPHQLSGGQRQRAMIAMALALEPAILIADEPTTALDVTTQAQILALIHRIQGERHMGVLFITHDFGVVSEIADRVAVMQSGKIVETGSAPQVLGAPRHPYTRSLIAAIPSLVPKERKRAADAPALLSAIALEKSYRSGGSLLGGKDHRVVHAAKRIDLTVHRGETLGLVGESGSGKSTVARCIARLAEADGGRILLGDVDLRPLSRRELRPYRRRIQMVFQDPYGSLNPRRTVGQLIAEGPMVHGMREREAMAKASSLLELVGMDPRAVGRYPHEFSGGQRQRIGIARALALDPEVLVADEPVSALDVSIQAQVLKLLADIRDRLHLTMLFITHDLRVAAQVCDTIAVMRYGEIVEHGATAEVFRNPQNAYTRELLAAVPGKELGMATGIDRGGAEASA